MQITLNLADPTATSIALDDVIFTQAEITLTFAVYPSTDSLADGLSVALLTPQGDTLAHALVSASTAILDTSTVECYEFARGLPVEATRGAYLVIGDSTHPLAIIPVQVARNPIAEIAPPTDYAPIYPTAIEMQAILTQIEEARKAYVVDTSITAESLNPVTSKAIYDALADKQNKLTAGKNITICTDGTINAKGITVDTSLIPSSSNPVQNKVIYTALDKKQDAPNCNVTQFGRNTSAGTNGVAIGANASATNGVSIGFSAHSPNASIAIGKSATLCTAATYAIAIGENVYVGMYGTQSIIIGGMARSLSPKGIAIGYCTTANICTGVAIGAGMTACYGVPIIIGSQAFPSATIRVTNCGKMTIGGKAVGGGDRYFGTWAGDASAGWGDVTMLGANSINGKYPRLHARNRDIHAVTGFSNDCYYNARFILPWTEAMSNDTSYLSAYTKFTVDRGMGGTQTFIQPLVPKNEGTTKYAGVEYAIPAFENSPVYWNGQILYNYDGCATRGVTIPWQKLKKTDGIHNALALDREMVFRYNCSCGSVYIYEGATYKYGFTVDKIVRALRGGLAYAEANGIS